MHHNYDARAVNTCMAIGATGTVGRVMGAVGWWVMGGINRVMGGINWVARCVPVVIAAVCRAGYCVVRVNGYGVVRSV